MTLLVLTACGAASGNGARSDLAARVGDGATAENERGFEWLPEAVKNALDANWPGATWLSAEQEGSGDDAEYDVLVETVDGDVVDIELAADGSIVEVKEADEDEDDDEDDDEGDDDEGDDDEGDDDEGDDDEDDEGDEDEDEDDEGDEDEDEDDEDAAQR